MWIASELEGVQLRDGDGQVLESIAPDDRKGLAPGSSIEQVGTGADGAVWIAGSQGLSMWNAGDHRFEPVPGAPRSLVYGFALGDGGSTVWLARFGALEAYRWHGAGMALQRRFDGRQGLPALAPNGLAISVDGVVWMTSVRGLIRFDPSDASPAASTACSTGCRARNSARSRCRGRKMDASRPQRPTDWCCSTRPSCIRPIARRRW